MHTQVINDQYLSFFCYNQLIKIMLIPNSLQEEKEFKFLD